MGDYVEDSYALKRLAESLANIHIKNNRVRYYFMYDINSFINNVHSGNAFGDIDNPYARELINTEFNYLIKQQQVLLREEARQFALFKEQEEERKSQQIKESMHLFLAAVGFIGGGGQIFAGLVVGFTPLGIILLSHGVNNIYENGYYLIYRKNTTGPIRYGYRLLAKGLKKEERFGDMLYATTDIGLSVNGLLRHVLKPEAWRLFRYINADYIINIKRIGAFSLSIEEVNDFISANDIYNLYKQ